jgi:hypothetical protein
MHPTRQAQACQARLPKTPATKQIENPMKAIQVTDEYKSQSDAQQALASQAIQDGYLGGRVINPGIKGGWRIQAFHKADGITESSFLPDGMRLVTLVPALEKSFAITTKENSIV